MKCSIFPLFIVFGASLNKFIGAFPEKVSVGSTTEPPVPTTCTNTCIYRGDGVCDDPRGTKYCEFGTDCQDCGPAITCTNTCIYPRDGVCDDPRGTKYCELGTDCQDCGPAPTSHPTIPPTEPPVPITCTNTCIYPRDGVCDDPRGTKYCELGTDCEDCGPVPTTRPTKPSTEMPVPVTCTNTCIYPRDGVCDDPRGTKYCELGTDCQDCGPVGSDNFTRSDDDGWWDDDDDYWASQKSVGEGNLNPTLDNQQSFATEPDTPSHKVDVRISLLFVLIFVSVFAVLWCITMKVAPKW